MFVVLDGTCFEEEGRTRCGMRMPTFEVTSFSYSSFSIKVMLNVDTSGELPSFEEGRESRFPER